MFGKIQDRNTVAAVVITFNRLGFLKEIVGALKNQTRKPDKIIIVNNSSTDGTTEWLSEQFDLYVVVQDNVGSSGGQHTGMKTAFERGFDWIWVMDDDVVPEPDCLGVLLKDLDEDTIRAPLRFTNEGKPFLNDAISYNLKNPFRSVWNNVVCEQDLNKKYIPAVGLTFEGPLINRKVIEKIGLPEFNFFIYGDDTEYFIRASRNGFKSVVATDARSHRKLPAVPQNKGYDWKQYYYIRNIIAIDVLHGSKPVRWIRPWGYFVTWLFRSRSFKELKITIKAFLGGYFYKSSKLLS